MSATRHGACGQTWWQSGNRTGHCSSCHLNFDGLSAFDRHRRAGACLDPLHAEDAGGALIFAVRTGTHDADRGVWYFGLRSEPFDAAAVFGGGDE